MSVKLRQELERRIARTIIQDAIEQGYTLDVNDSEETTLKGSTDVKAILKAMFTTDEDYLILHRGKEQGWIRFVYGNDGWDVVNDYTVNLEDVMTSANKLADKYS